jgi:hypothetical protein
MPRETLVKQLERMTDHQGRTLFFVTRPISRRRRPLFFEPDQVPPFEGEIGWFEMQRDGKGGWIVHRQVARPQGL